MNYVLPQHPFPDHVIAGMTLDETEATFARALDVRDLPLPELTPGDAACLLLVKALLHESLGHFVRWVFPNYLWGRHLVDLVHLLERIAARDPTARWTCVSTPPRGGKSQLCSVIFPAWILGRAPSTEVIIATYSSGLAEELGGKGRMLIQSPAWQFAFGESCKLDDRSQSVTQMRTLGIKGDGHKPGSLLWVGRSGAVTGRGADVVVLDDMLANDEEAQSPAIKATLHSFITFVASSRLSPGGAVLSVSSRFAVDDATGFLVNAEGSTFTHMQYPAIDEDGDALHPERYSLDEYKIIRDKVKNRAWAFLYQGQPTLAGHGHFRAADFCTFEDIDVPTHARLALSADLSRGGDNHCIVVAALVENTQTSMDDILVLLVANFKASLPDAMTKFINITQQCSNFNHALQFILPKDGIANGPYVLDRIYASGLRHAFTWLPDTKAKLIKAQASIAAVEEGSMRFKRGASWLPGLIEECEQFTGDPGAVDNQVDAISNIARAVRGKLIRARRETTDADNVYSIHGGNYDPTKPMGGNIRLPALGDHTMDVIVADRNSRY